VATVFLNAYRSAHPHDEIAVIDLWKKQLPPFDGDVIDAKYAIMHEQEHTEAQAKAWKEVENLISEFKHADKYVISLPMWNFGIPYKLKHYIDLLVQPGYAFKVTQSGAYEGLIKGKKLMIVYSRGGAYGSETGAEGLDLQKKYMEIIMPFIGFQNISSLIVEPTLQGDEKKKKAVDLAKEQALKAAATF
jgi:FMN-dependent NADH-azoreductase